MRGGERIQEVIVNCISYLDTRTEFWHQQKPIYARERERKLMQQKWNKTRHKPPSDPTRFVLKSLEEIDAGKMDFMMNTTVFFSCFVYVVFNLITVMLMYLSP